MGALADKVAVVTGAAAGMGEAIARLFAQEGTSVVLADLTEESGEVVAREIGPSDGSALFVRTDVSEATQVQHLIRVTVETYGKLDILVNNAGVEGSHMGLLEDADEDEFDWIVSVNLRGVFLGMKYALPELVKTQGVIVNTASLAGLAGVPGMGVYSASKGGVVQLTKVAVLEYAATGVRVNCVCPGYIRTDMTSRLSRMPRDGRLRAPTPVPAGRAGLPEDVARAVLYLASHSSSFVTGVALPVDGGSLSE